MRQGSNLRGRNSSQQQSIQVKSKQMHRTVSQTDKNFAVVQADKLMVANQYNINGFRSARDKQSIYIPNFRQQQQNLGSVIGYGSQNQDSQQQQPPFSQIVMNSLNQINSQGGISQSQLQSYSRKNIGQHIRQQDRSVDANANLQIFQQHRLSFGQANNIVNMIRSTSNQPFSARQGKSKEQSLKNNSQSESQDQNEDAQKLNLSKNHQKYNGQREIIIRKHSKLSSQTNSQGQSFHQINPEILTNNDNSNLQNQGVPLLNLNPLDMNSGQLTNRGLSQQQTKRNSQVRSTSQNQDQYQNKIGVSQIVLGNQQVHQSKQAQVIHSQRSGSQSSRPSTAFMSRTRQRQQAKQGGQSVSQDQKIVIPLNKRQILAYNHRNQEEPDQNQMDPNDVNFLRKLNQNVGQNQPVNSRNNYFSQISHQEPNEYQTNPSDSQFTKSIQSTNQQDSARSQSQQKQYFQIKQMNRSSSHQKIQGIKDFKNEKLQGFKAPKCSDLQTIQQIYNSGTQFSTIQNVKAHSQGKQEAKHSNQQAKIEFKQQQEYLKLQQMQAQQQQAQNLKNSKIQPAQLMTFYHPKEEEHTLNQYATIEHSQIQTTHPNQATRFNQNSDHQTSLQTSVYAAVETPLKNYNQNIKSLVKKQYKEDSQQYSVMSNSNMTSDQKPKVDISSTGGSNSQFLSKLRLKRGGIGRNQNNLINQHQYISVNQSSGTAQSQIVQPISSNLSYQSYINSMRESTVKKPQTKDEQIGEQKLVVMPQTQMKFLDINNNLGSRASKLFNQNSNNIMVSSRNSEQQIIQSSNISNQNYQNTSQSPVYKSAYSMSSGTINGQNFTQENFIKNEALSQNQIQIQNNEPSPQIAQRKAFNIKSRISQQNNYDEPQKNYFTKLESQNVKRNLESQINQLSKQQQQTQPQQQDHGNYFTQRQQSRNKEQAAFASGQISSRRVPSHQEMLDLIQFQQLQLKNQEEQLLQLKHQRQLQQDIDQSENQMIILSKQVEHNLGGGTRTKTSSIDLSNIERSTPYKRDITLSESYITKVGDTTNEDFFEIIKMMDDAKRQ
eukprot:403367982